MVTKSNKSKILWISPFVPYDKVPHAGGKVHNYYIKYFKKNFTNDIHLLTLALEKEVSDIDLHNYGIVCNYIVRDASFFTRCISTVMDMESKYNPFHILGSASNFEQFCLRKLAKSYYYKNKYNHPDFIILQWTQAGFLINYLKKYYPNSKYIIIEEDVSFQGAMRQTKYASNFLKKIFKALRANQYKHAELSALNLADIVTVNNYKDKQLLINEKVFPDKIVQVAPYFENMTDLKTEKRNKNLIFYGAMNRKENYLSVIWFIENVFRYLNDSDIVFFVVGGNPHKSLLKFQSERIKIVGFVENVGKYFKNSLCLVAPLVLGAGIKIKVLEALSAGIPVLTNDIGAEGIGIINEVNYLHCNRPSDYITAIHRLINDPDLQNRIGNNGRQFIMNNFNINKTLDNLMDKMLDDK